MKTFNFWRTLVCTVMAVAAFTACSDDDDEKGFSGEPSITVNGASSAAVATDLDGGDTQAVEVVSAGPWTLSFDTAGADTWCTPSAMSSKGGTTMLKFNLGQTTAEREATVKLTATGQIAGYPITRTATITIKQNQGGSTGTETNVAQVRALVVAQNPTSEVDASAEIKAVGNIVGIVTCDPSNKNFNNASMINLQDNDLSAKNSGIAVFVGGTNAQKCATGMKVSISLANAKVQKFNGTLQLSLSGADVETVETGIALTAPSVTPDEFPDYESQLVSIAKVQTATEYENKTYAQEYNAIFVTETGEEFTVRTASSANATFGTTVISNLSGPIVGIAQVYQKDNSGAKTVQLAPRNANDVAGLTETRFTIQVDYTKATIAQITAEGAYEVENASVVAKSAKSLVIADASNAYMPVYIGATTDFAINDKLTLKGQVKLNGDGPLQFSSPEITKNGTQAYTVGAAEVFDAAKVNAWMQSPVTKYVEVEGVLTSTDGKYYNLTIAGISSDYKGGSIDNPTDEQKTVLNALIGKPVVVKGFAISTYSKWFTLMLGEVSASDEPFISADASASFAAAGETKEISYSANNLGSNSVFAKISGTDAAQFEIVGTPANGKVSVKALENTAEAAKNAVLTLYIAASEGATAITSATVNLQQAGVTSGAGYTLVDKVSALAAGDYIMTGFLESYSSGSTNLNWAPYSYHAWVGKVSGAEPATKNSDLQTVNYQYSNNQLIIDPDLSDQDKAKGTAATITLESVTGQANTFYIKVGGKYLKSFTADTNRRLGLADEATGAEWVFTDFSKGGIVASNNGVYLGTAGATYDLLRSYKAASYESSLRNGLYFFKAN